jgi:alpha-1,3-rhamnosyl/mannosyltransferase
MTGRSLLVDGRGIAHSGLGRYLREVLARVSADPRFGRVTLLGHPGEARRFAPGAEVLPFPHGFYSPVGQARWLALAARGALRHDVAFLAHYDVPFPGPPPRSVVVVHDLSHFTLAHFPAWKVALAGAVLRQTVKRAARVVVPSLSTRDALLERFPWAAPRVRVVSEGVDPSWAAPAGPLPAGVEGPYLLCVGNRKLHKNLVTAVEVLHRVRPVHPGMRLVLAGGGGEDSDAVRERVEALGVREAVVELRGVDDEGLRALYAGAACFLFPSLTEGFGLPVLEAMAAGAPVVASSRTSIPEVVGDAGILAGPHDVEALAAGVLRCLDDPAFRAALVERGRARAAGFRWDVAAGEIADLLCEVAG